ncbi:MAG: hypothetical protein V4456_16355 [Bacteroidota bacterium]
MKKIILVLCLFNATVAAAQKIPDSGFNHVRLSEEDRTISFETLPVSGPPGTVPTKTYFWYASGHIQSTQGGYSGKLLNGFYRIYFLNKNLSEEGTFDTGLRHGVWKKWNEAGVLREMITWQNGIKNGAYSQFDENGQVLSVTNYKNGVLEGVSKQYVTKDSVVTTHYHNGKIVQPAPFLKRINPFRRKKSMPAPQTS